MAMLVFVSVADPMNLLDRQNLRMFSAVFDVRPVAERNEMPTMVRRGGATLHYLTFRADYSGRFRESGKEAARRNSLEFARLPPAACVTAHEDGEEKTTGMLSGGSWSELLLFRFRATHAQVSGKHMMSEKHFACKFQQPTVNRNSQVTPR